MDFKHTEERQMLIDTIRRYLQNEYELVDRNNAACSAQGFDDKHWQAFAELGLLGAFFEEQDGGFGGFGYDIFCVFEELGRALVVEPLADCALIPGKILAEIGDMERLSKIIEGELRIAVAFDEYDARYDRSRCSTTAKRTENGWELDGAKAMVKYAGQSASMLVSAQTGDCSDQLSVFIVPIDTQGVTQVAHTLFDGGQAADVALTKVALPPEALIGALNEGNELGSTLINSCLRA